MNRTPLINYWNLRRLKGVNTNDTPLNDYIDNKKGVATSDTLNNLCDLITNDPIIIKLYLDTCLAVNFLNLLE